MRMFRILGIWPPSVPTYFNAGHHLPLWEVAGYLRREVHRAEVDIVDAGVLNYTWKEIADLLLNSYDLICIINEYDNVEGVRRLTDYARAVSPQSKLITYGRVSGVIPEFFCDYGLDAVVVDGDFEIAVVDYVALIRGELSLSQARGLLIKNENGWQRTAAGHFLEASEWAYPPVSEMPLDSYARLSARPENRFSAIPGKHELTVSVARGCPIGCDYCLVPMYQGLRERRRNVSSVIDHIEQVKAEVNIDYVSMYAPTFSLNRNWVLEFCERIKQVKVPWKCCTTVHHLDEELVARMGDSGCIRISVGLETLDAEAQLLLPKAKRIGDPQLEKLSEWCKKAGIELNCFVMVGMPNQTKEGVRHTFEYLQELGVKIRPTAYTPYQQIGSKITEADLSSFFTRQITKQILLSGITPAEFYSLELNAEVIPQSL